MSQPLTLADWVAFLSLGVGGYAAMSVPFFLLVDADRSDFDPRPAVSQLVESGRVDPLLIAVFNAKAAVRDAALDAAALLILLTTTPKGALR
ncbi:hypothetical protein [Streptomyces sp. NPDC020298]|uniref:hypothetical protein n=1 Tax=unclassified Streptomyces TaxID=2593676 RepID=UPI0033E99035